MAKVLVLSKTKDTGVSVGCTPKVARLQWRAYSSTPTASCSSVRARIGVLKTASFRVLPQLISNFRAGENYTKQARRVQLPARDEERFLVLPSNTLRRCRGRSSVALTGRSRCSGC